MTMVLANSNSNRCSRNRKVLLVAQHVALVGLLILARPSMAWVQPVGGGGGGGVGIVVNNNDKKRTTTSTTSSSTALQSSNSGETWFSYDQLSGQRPQSLEGRKAALLQLGAALDRGQAYNPTSGEYYASSMQVAKNRIYDILQVYPDRVPRYMNEIEGEWELVLTTVPHGIFRSSPFFLAIQEAYEVYDNANKSSQHQQTGIDGNPQQRTSSSSKADLFFKLHELQTCSWGVSKVGRVAQHITSTYLYSEFDTSLFSLTVIPLLGWFKLLPTFGGCVVTAAKADLANDGSGLLQMKVDYTTARKVPGLSGLGDWTWNIKVPVGSIWKVLPWNKGRDADCRVYVRYVDDDFRIVEDVSGDYFVYTRPVVPRPLDLVYEEQQGGQQQYQ
jgi:hypothetical protein